MNLDSAIHITLTVIKLAKISCFQWARAKSDWKCKKAADIKCFTGFVTEQCFQVNRIFYRNELQLAKKELTSSTNKDATKL